MKKIKSNKIYTPVLLLLLCLLTAACAENEFSDVAGMAEDGVTIRLVIPSATVTVTRAEGDADETDIENLYVAEYDVNGTCLALRQVDIAKQLTTADGKYQLTLKSLKQGTAEVHILANAASVLETYNNSSLPQQKPDALFSDYKKAPFILWGYVTKEQLRQPNKSVSLIRNVAKATISMDEKIKGNRSIQSWKIVKTANKGSLAPKSYEALSAGNPNITDEDNFDTSVDDTEGTPPLYFFETPVKKGDTNVDTRIVLKSGDKFYTARFLNEEGEQLPLLRNHHYEITVKELDGGYDSEEKALAAPPGNVRLEIKDHNCLITNLVSNGTFELGTCDTVRVVSDGGTDDKSAYFVIMCGKDVEFPADESPKVKVEKEEEVWIKDLQITEDATTADAYSSAGKKYTLSFSFGKNPTEKPRQGNIIISFRTLTGSICIEQAGSNLKKERPTTIFGLVGDDAATGRDYIKFLTQTVNGVSADAMGGRGVRNNGLQLGIGPDNNYTYKIEKKERDKVTLSSQKIKVTEKEEYFIIEAIKTDDSETWMNESLVIETADGTTISYDLYHNGIFWQLPKELNYEKEEAWCYYEMVESDIEGLEDIWMLDRNIGATSVNDAGYHCLLIEGNKTEPIAGICPPGFTLPSASLWKSILPKLKTETRYNADGSSYQSIELGSEDEKGIRFPLGGFNNGFTVENEGIGYYWSQTPVSGNQGFDANSAEYGYWYNIARVSTGGSGLLSIRYVGGSNGETDGHYKHLSTRCVLDNGKVTDKNRLTIHDERDNYSAALYVYISTEGDEYRNRPFGEMIRPDNSSGSAILYYDMIDPEIIQASIGKPLYIRFREGDDLQDEGWIGKRVAIGETREFRVDSSSQDSPEL